MRLQGLAQQPNDFEIDPRYRQCTREMWASVIYWVAYTIATVGVAWWLGGNTPADDLDFVFGIPAWMFWAGVASLVFCTVGAVVLVKFFFQDFSILADDRDNNNDAGG